MSYLPDLSNDVPVLAEHEPFWRHCRAGELRFQRCTRCARVQHPPSPHCAECGSADQDWVLASNDAELFSFTVVRHATDPLLTSSLPYNVAIVAFPSLQWVRIVSNVVDVAPEALRIGMPLELVWDGVGDGRKLPRFRSRGT